MEKVLPYIESNKERYLAELKEFLAIPSVSSQKEHDGDTRKMRSMGVGTDEKNWDGECSDSPDRRPSCCFQ